MYCVGSRGVLISLFTSLASSQPTFQTQINLYSLPPSFPFPIKNLPTHGAQPLFQIRRKPDALNRFLNESFSWMFLWNLDCEEEKGGIFFFMVWRGKPELGLLSSLVSHPSSFLRLHFKKSMITFRMLPRFQGLIKPHPHLLRTYPLTTTSLL